MSDANPERVRSALQYIDPHNREVWVKMAFAIKDEFGEAGFDIWDEWGSAHPRPASEVKATWKSARPGGKVKLGSLIFDAKAAGWQDDGKYAKPSAAEIEKRNAAAAERAARYAAEEAAAHAAAAAKAAQCWSAGVPCDVHPYLTSKNVPSLGLRVGIWEYESEDTGEIFQVPGTLLIPLYDRSGKIHSLQGIESAPGKPKRYLKDGAKRGHFYPIGKPQAVNGRRVFVVVEGYATGASVHVATGHMVLVAFDTSNLLAVAQSVRERNPDAIILFAADNDLWTRKPDGSPTNPGVLAASKAAQAVSGRVVPPPFTVDDAWGVDDKGRQTGPKDWNDWHCMNGVESIASAFRAALDALLNPQPAQPVPAASVPAEAAPVAEEAPAAPKPDGTGVDEPDEDWDAVDPSAHFHILGYDRGVFYVFIHALRQISDFRSGELSDTNFLMMAPLEWWEMYFQSSGKAGGFDRKAAVNWFFRRAGMRGIFDASRVRGRGAWIDDGRVVYHQGNALYVDGKKLDVTKIRSRYVYEMAKTEEQVGDTATTDAEGHGLVEIAKMLRWSKPGAALLLAGWTFLAPVCGAIRWRPHIWLTGAAGCGKSTILNEYVRGCLGAAKLYAQGNSSEAGIRQKLKADAIPVLYDESEQDNESEKRRVGQILALIRQASTESEAKTYKGTVGGDAMNFHIRSMFCLASVQAGLENKADIDRLTKLTLRPGAKDDPAAKAHWAKVKDALYSITRDTTLPGRMLKRAVGMLPTIQANINVFTDVAAQVLGTQRMGDQYGTMLAGCWSLISSAVATPEDARKMLQAYEWDEFLDGTETDDSEKALQAIMEAKIGLKGDHFAVGSIVAIANGGFVDGVGLDVETAARLLRENGMRILGSSLVFRNGSLALRKLLEGTRFEVDIKGQLLRIPGAKITQKSVRFGSSGSDVQRGVEIPLSYILGDDEPPI